ncbi:MAG: hypothetical protein K2H56_03900 [Malacoplasma sp.]|nr:hypothetical protein [Malacoplasma sp.]
MAKSLLFDLKNNCKRIEVKKLNLEKDIQKIIEKNLKKIFNIDFLETEWAIKLDNNEGTGRMDTIAIDEDNCPVIIEYKLNKNQTIITQGLYYLNWLKNHFGNFYELVSKKLGTEKANLIDKQNPKLYLISREFSKYDIHAINQIIGNNDVYLISYEYYQNPEILSIEFLNNFSKNNIINSEEKSFDLGNDSNESTRKYENEFEKIYNSLEKEKREIVDLLTEKIQENFNNEVLIKDTELYRAFKKNTNFCSLVLKKKHMKLYIHLKYDETMKDYKNIEDCQNKGHWGTGDIEVFLQYDMEEFNKIFHFIEKAYEIN